MLHETACGVPPGAAMFCAVSRRFTSCSVSFSMASRTPGSSCPFDALRAFKSASSFSACSMAHWCPSAPTMMRLPPSSPSFSKTPGATWRHAAFGTSDKASESPARSNRTSPSAGIDTAAVSSTSASSTSWIAGSASSTGAQPIAPSASPDKPSTVASNRCEMTAWANDDAVFIMVLPRTAEGCFAAEKRAPCAVLAAVKPFFSRPRILLPAEADRRYQRRK